MSRAWALALAMALGCGGNSGGAGPAAPSEPVGPEPAEEDDGELARVRAVEGAINELSAAMHACWGAAAADTLDLEGEIILEVAIGEGGAAAAVEVVRDTASREPLASCLVRLWEGHTWPAGSFADGEVVQLPPLRFVAEDRQLAIDADLVTERELEGGATARVVLREANTGNDDASITLVRVPPGAQLALPRGAESATLVYAIGGAGGALAAGDAAYAPAGAQVRVTAGDEPLELLVAYAPAGPEAGFLDGATGGGAPEGDEEQDVSLRPAGGAATYEIAAGLGEVTLYVESGADGEVAASLGVLTARPQMVVPPHVHDGASEYLYLLSGRGSMTAGGETFEVEGGTGIQVPRGVEHAFEVEGDEPVAAIQIYAPAGPEQRFKTN